MSVKKAVPRRRPQPKPVAQPTTSRGTVVNSIIGAVVTLGLAWIGLQQHVADSARDRIEVKLADQGKTLTTVWHNTDGALTASLLVAAKMARRVAVLSGEPQDIQIAEDAEKAYTTQKELQLRAEAAPPPKP